MFGNVFGKLSYSLKKQYFILDLNLLILKAFRTLSKIVDIFGVVARVDKDCRCYLMGLV